MPLSPAITNLEELKSHPALALLLAWNPSAVEAMKYDRDEMTIYVDRGLLREACAILKDDSECEFNFLSDITCVDWYPAEPGLKAVYTLLALSIKQPPL